MKPRPWLLSITLVLVFFGVNSAARAQQAAHVPEQLDFSAEDQAVHHPVPIPEAVQKLLIEDEDTKVVIESAKLPTDKFPASDFSASEIHLGTSKDVDLVVEAEGDFMGANVTLFWVFILTPDGFKLARKLPAHDLSIARTRHNGYRNITASAETCCVISTVRLRYDGTQYMKYSSSSKEIR